MPDSHAPNLKIVVINTVTIPTEQSDHDDPALLQQMNRSRDLRIGLLQAGYNIIASIPGDMYLVDRLTQLQPDMIIIDAESDARDVLEELVLG